MNVLVEKKGAVTTIIINRPEVRNAVDGPTASELAVAVRAFEADDESRVAVLTGTGGYFCSGADLKALSEAPERSNRAEQTGDGPLGISRMYIQKPIIAAVAGYAVAGGLELALLCDMRVMERDAYFGVFCRRWGVPLVDGGTVRLPRLIGLSRAMDMILTGRPVGADEAYAMGLANRVVDTGTAREEAEALAEQIAAFPRRCVLSDRRSAHEQFGMPFNEAMKNEFALGQATVKSGETVEGATRFASGEGRHGVFE